MKFSEGRVSYLAHQIVAVLRQEGLAQIENERHVLKDIKRVFSEHDEHEARLDAVVRRKIASLSRQVPVGSREWDILYQKYLAEEQRKQKG